MVVSPECPLRTFPKMPRKSGKGALDPRSSPKGRAVEAQALSEVRELLGDAARDRDLLIEHLHRIQDTYAHLSARHLNALAHEMHLTQAEVYEVASFYHHFDIVKNGDTPPAPVAVRVCDSISCKLAGADALLQALTASAVPGVRVLPASCIGRCEAAPAVVVGRATVDRATVASVQA